MPEKEKMEMICYRYGIRNFDPPALEESGSGEAWYYPLSRTQQNASPFPVFCFENKRDATRWCEKMRKWTPGDCRVMSIQQYLKFKGKGEKA
jgi:hypothetical protein